VRRHRERDGRVDARQLLDADAVVDGRHRGPAILFGELDAHQPERRHLPDERARETPGRRPTHARRGGSRSRRTRGRRGAAPAAARWTEIHQDWKCSISTGLGLRREAGGPLASRLSLSPAGYWLLPPVRVRRAVLDEPAADELTVGAPGKALALVVGRERLLDLRQPVERHARKVVMFEMVVGVKEGGVQNSDPASACSTRRGPSGRCCSAARGGSA